MGRRGCPTDLDISRARPTVPPVGASVSFDICSLSCHFSFSFFSSSKTARYRQKYCVKESLNPKQPINSKSWPVGSEIDLCCLNIHLVCHDTKYCTFS